MVDSAFAAFFDAPFFARFFPARYWLCVGMEQLLQHIKTPLPSGPSMPLAQLPTFLNSVQLAPCSQTTRENSLPDPPHRAPPCLREKERLFSPNGAFTFRPNAISICAFEASMHCRAGWLMVCCM